MPPVMQSPRFLAEEESQILLPQTESVVSFETGNDLKQKLCILTSMRWLGIKVLIVRAGLLQLLQALKAPLAHILAAPCNPHPVTVMMLNSFMHGCHPQAAELTQLRSHFTSI